MTLTPFAADALASLFPVLLVGLPILAVLAYRRLTTSPCPTCGERTARGPLPPDHWHHRQGP